MLSFILKYCVQHVQLEQVCQSRTLIQFLCGFAGFAHGMLSVFLAHLVHFCLLLVGYFYKHCITSTLCNSSYCLS